MSQAILFNAAPAQQNAVQGTFEQAAHKAVQVNANFRAPRVSPPAPRSLDNRVNNLDIMMMLNKIMELIYAERTMQRDARRLERLEQIKNYLETMRNHMDQGNSLKSTAIGGAVMSFLGAFLPMFGYTSWGDKVKGWISPLNKMSTPDMFKQWGKMATSGVQISQNVGQIQTAFREGERVVFTQKTDIARTDSDECTRSMQHTDEDIRNILNFLIRLLENELAEVRAEFGGN